MNISLFSEEWKVMYELGKKETREGGQDPVSFSEYIRRYQDEDLYCVTGLTGNPTPDILDSLAFREFSNIDCAVNRNNNDGRFTRVSPRRYPGLPLY